MTNADTLRRDFSETPSPALIKSLAPLFRKRPARAVNLSAEAVSAIRERRETEHGWFEHKGRQVMFDLNTKRAWA